MYRESAKNRVLGVLFLDPSKFHDVATTGQTRNVLCEYVSEYSCQDGQLALPGKCLIKSDEQVTWPEAREFCRDRGARNIIIRNEDENVIFAGMLAKKEAGWLLPSHEQTWSSEKKYINYWRWYFDGLDNRNLKCSGVSQHAVISQNAKNECSLFGFWKVDNSANKNIALCTKDADCPFCQPPMKEELAEPSIMDAPACIAKNDPPRQKDLWHLSFYYNWGRILHAFAATPAGYKTIMSNGIGYSGSSGSGSLGATISDEGFKRLHLVCSDTEQQKHIVKMWFTKTGQSYTHIFEGSKSPKQVYVGYVALKKNACGAKHPIKRWGCLMSADRMYATDLNWNTWYRGRVLNGGKVAFWTWEWWSAREKQRKGCGAVTDKSPKKEWLMNLKYYYNVKRALHAYAANKEGLDKIMKNGIGYEKSKKSFSIGKTLKMDKIEDLKKICSRADHLKKLYFIRTGNAYVHSFGSGDILCGWVAVHQADCGAHTGQKKYTSASSEDIFYTHQNLDANKAYKGRVQDGGKVQFYLW